jgi:hypothetical protein
MEPANDKSRQSESGGWWKNNWVKCIDALAKIVAAGAVAGVALIAHNFESAMSATSLLNQREQAETNLRATLLHDLITTVTDRVDSEKGIDSNRELVLVKLLTLNFHDHFEFKPLLLDLDQRLALKKDNKARRALQSVARRIVDRQVNKLLAIGREADRPAKSVSVYFEQGANFNAPLKESCDQWAETDEDTSGMPENIILNKDQPAHFVEAMSQKVCVFSPDRQYILEISLQKFDEHAGSVSVYASILRHDQTPIASFDDFTITPYDFPFTDNTKINYNLRFALSLYNIPEPGNSKIQLKVVWFPKGFITERERPVNYLEVRKWLGLKEESQ